MELNTSDIIKKLKEIESKSTCTRRKIAAIAINGFSIIAEGVNGSYGERCSLNGCLRDKLQIESGSIHSPCYGIHAEIKLLEDCVDRKICVDGLTIVCTYSPCKDCATILASKQIKSFLYLNSYPDESYKEIFSKNNISFGKLVIREESV